MQISKDKGEELLEEDAVVVGKSYFPSQLAAKLNAKLVLQTIEKLQLRPHPRKRSRCSNISVRSKKGEGRCLLFWLCERWDLKNSLGGLQLESQKDDGGLHG